MFPLGSYIYIYVDFFIYQVTTTKKNGKNLEQLYFKYLPTSWDILEFVINNS